MDRIFIIVGKSASGKDTIYQKLCKICDVNPIVYYTTRPKRVNEKDGVDYFYVENKVIDAAEKNKTLIEKRTYTTAKGIWTYATINDGQFDVDGDGIIVLPPQAYFSFVSYFGKDKIVPIYIDVPDGIRLRRSIDRDEKQEVPNYAETCRRFLSDAEDFKNFHPNISFNNDVVDRCVGEIIAKVGIKVKK